MKRSQHKSRKRARLKKATKAPYGNLDLDFLIAAVFTLVNDPFAPPTRHIDEMDAHLELQVGLVLRRQLLEGVLVDVVPPHLNVDALAAQKVDTLTLTRQNKNFTKISLQIGTGTVCQYYY